MSACTTTSATVNRNGREGRRRVPGRLRRASPAASARCQNARPTIGHAGRATAPPTETATSPAAQPENAVSDQVGPEGPCRPGRRPAGSGPRYSDVRSVVIVPLASAMTHGGALRGLPVTVAAALTRSLTWTHRPAAVCPPCSRCGGRSVPSGPRGAGPAPRITGGLTPTART